MRTWRACAPAAALSLALTSVAGGLLAQNIAIDPVAAFRCEQTHENANYGDAFRACRPLAEQGLADAQLILADLYQRGLGTPQDFGAAARWHRAAAEQGLPQAQFNLGIQYRYGSGVPQDLVEAHVWLSRAASAGVADAATALSLTERRMSQTQLATARTQAAQGLAPSPTAAPPAQPTPSQREIIAAAQARLSQLGYSPGPADGLMGERTRTAIRQFQAARNLPIDGQATGALVTQLDTAVAERQSAAAAPSAVTNPTASSAATQPHSALPAPLVQASNPAVQRLVDALKARLAEPAAQTADRDFLAGLQELVQRYDWPWSQQALSDDFSDGDYSTGPTWTAVAGEFSVSSTSGLVTRETAATQRRSTTTDRGDIASQLFGAIVSEVLQSQLGTQPTTAPMPEIVTSLVLANAFVLTMDMSARSIEDRPNGLTIGLFQDQQRTAAYQLRYAPGANSRIELVRTGGGRSAVIATGTTARPIDDGQVHTLQWRRAASGEMVVLIDETEVARATDRGLTGRFIGLRIANEGGVYGIRRVVVHGVPL